MGITNEIHPIITINYGMFLWTTGAIACDYGKQFICPNCGEPFDGHECENCKYTEER